MEQTNEVANATPRDLVKHIDLGMADELSSDDCLKGRITLLQKMSRVFDDPKCDLRPGQIVNSADNEVLGTGDKPLEFIIVDFIRYWLVKDVDTKEFVERLPGINEKEYKWEENVGGRNLKRTFNFSYIVLLTKDIEAGIEMPYELTFRSTSLKKSKLINSILLKLRAKEIPSWDKVFSLGVVTESDKEGNTWFMFEPKLSRDSSAKESSYAKECRGQLLQIKDAIMNSSDAGEDSETKSYSKSGAQAGTVGTAENY